MIVTYPIAISERTIKGLYIVSAPDFPLFTQGHDLKEALFMAKDAIGLMCVCLQEDGKPLPNPSTLESVVHDPSDTLELVEVDLIEYRKSIEKILNME